MIKRISGNFVEWCREVVASDNYVILDTETTGFAGDILELAIIDAQGNILYDSLLRPACAIEEGAMKQHHISEAMMNAAPCINDEWDIIHSKINGKKLIAYNAKFDAGRLKYAMTMHNIPFQEFEWYCIMMEYAQFWDAPSERGVWLGSQLLHKGNAPYQKLQAACQQQGIEFDQKHRALGDTLATLEIIKRIAERGEKAPTYHTRERDPWE